jgi:D-beta-D-heptose 7-phosphate kinase/D-beta-D-heptose 1-phosphate adenosyltransferase
VRRGHASERWDAEVVLPSRGDGLALFQRGRAVQHFRLWRGDLRRHGAGDTVVATCALALGAGANLEEATVLANHAAGLVVGKVGTATVTAAELAAAVREG